MTKHIISNVEFIQCPYCFKQLKVLHWKHLKLHNKNIDNVLIEFPGYPTITLKEYNKKISCAKMGGDKVKQTHNSIKLIYCIYCNTPLEVKNNTSNKQACTNCLKNGLENPDGRTKENANQERRKTLQRKYGVSNAQNIPGISKRMVETQLNKYGNMGFNTKKSKDILLDRYGEDNIMKTEEGKRLLVESLKKKYGDTITNPLHLLEVVEKMKESKRKYYEINGHPLKGKTYEEIYGIEKAKEMRERRRVDGAQGYKKSIELGFCGPTIPQLQLYELVKELFNNVTLEFEMVGYFIDIAIPEYKIAIEYDGSWWHDKEHDDLRDSVLEEFGWNTIRFVDKVPTKEELIHEIENIIKTKIVD